MNNEKDAQIIIESDPFSMIPNDLVRNTAVSNDAVRIYLIIKSYIGIPDFTLYRNTVKKSFPGGEYSFKKGWKELKDLGYLVQIKEHINGRYTYSYKLLSNPSIQSGGKQSIEKQAVDGQGVDGQSAEKQEVEKQGVENQPVENQPSLIKKDSSKKDLNNNYYNNNSDKSENNKTTAIVEGHGNSVVEKTNDRSISKGFDKDRFMNSEHVVNQILRLYEAGYYSDEIKKEVTNAVKYLADSCNCFGTDNINIINQFTDDEYGDLFNMALELANDSAIYSNVFNKKGFLSEEIKKRIARHLVN